MNNLRQFILFAEEGKIYKRTLEDRQHQAKCINVVTNAIVLWNTIYIGKVIEQLESEGWDIVAEDLQHIFKNTHVYSFVLKIRTNGTERSCRLRPDRPH